MHARVGFDRYVIALGALGTPTSLNPARYAAQRQHLHERGRESRLRPEPPELEVRYCDEHRREHVGRGLPPRPCAGRTRGVKDLPDGSTRCRLRRATTGRQIAEQSISLQVPPRRPRRHLQPDCVRGRGPGIVISFGVTDACGWRHYCTIPADGLWFLPPHFHPSEGKSARIGVHSRGAAIMTVCRRGRIRAEPRVAALRACMGHGPDLSVPSDPGPATP